MAQTEGAPRPLARLEIVGRQARKRALVRPRSQNSNLKPPKGYISSCVCVRK